MATARRDTARVTSLGDTRRVEHGVDQRAEYARGRRTEDVPAVRNRDDAVLTEQALAAIERNAELVIRLMEGLVEHARRGEVAL